MKIQESAEHYLETIFILQNRNGSVRSIDIATELAYSKPSVSRAMKLLRERNYITMEETGQIKLSESGFALASNLFERHTVLSAFLVSTGVSPKTAYEDACRIEHVISEESFACLKAFIKQDQSKADQ